MLANSTIWKANRTKPCGVGKFNNLEGQSDEAVKTAVLANSTMSKTVKTAVLANSTIWKANRSARKNCGVGSRTCKNCDVGKFNDLEGQSDEAVACQDCGVGKFNDVAGCREQQLVLRALSTH